MAGNIATIQTLEQLETFSAAQRTLFVTDLEEGGLFQFTSESLTPDGINIIENTNLGGFFVRMKITNLLVDLTGEDGITVTGAVLGLVVPLKSDFQTNTFVGLNSGLNNTYLSPTQGAQNTFYGAESGRSNTTGYANAISGYGAAYYNTTGSAKTAFGYQTAYLGVTNNYGCYFGTDAGYFDGGDYNSFWGHHSGKGSGSVIRITGTENMVFGRETATLLTSGSYNSIFGNRAAFYLTTGSHNTTLGFLTGLNLTTGSMNTLSGREAGQSLTTHSNNVFTGYRAGFNATSSSNTGVGFSAFFNLTTGQGNTALGSGAGDDITTGSNNTFVGLNAGNNASQLVSVNFSTALGYNSYTTKNNQMVLGASVVTETLLRGTVLLNTETDDGGGAKLQVSGRAMVSTAPTNANDVVRLTELNAIADGNLSKTANYTVLTTDFGRNGHATVFVDATSGAVQIELPTAASMAGKTVNVIKTDASANAVTVKGNGATNINAANTYVISTQYDNVAVKSNGTQYYIFG